MLRSRGCLAGSAGLGRSPHAPHRRSAAGLSVAWTFPFGFKRAARPQLQTPRPSAGRGVRGDGRETRCCSAMKLAAVRRQVGIGGVELRGGRRSIKCGISCGRSRACAPTGTKTETVRLMYTLSMITPSASIVEHFGCRGSQYLVCISAFPWRSKADFTTEWLCAGVLANARSERSGLASRGLEFAENHAKSS